MKTNRTLAGWLMLLAFSSLNLHPSTGSAQTNQYLFTGSETNITLPPGTYTSPPTALKAATATTVRRSGGLGAEMGGEFNSAGVTSLTHPGWRQRRSGADFGGGGGGGSFVVKGSTPLVVAGGGGGGGTIGTAAVPG